MRFKFRGVLLIRKIRVMAEKPSPVFFIIYVVEYLRLLAKDSF